MYFPYSNWGSVSHIACHLSAECLVGVQFDLSKMNTYSSRLDFDRLPDFNKYHLSCKLQEAGERQQLLASVRSLLSEHKADR